MTVNGNSGKSGLDRDTKLIIGMVVAAIVVTGIVVAVMVGTVLGTQILHNGAEIRQLATRIADERDDLLASVRVEIGALRSELAAQVGPSHIEEVRRHYRHLNDRMYNMEHELSEVVRSVAGLRSDTSTARNLQERLQNIERMLEQLKRNP